MERFLAYKPPGGTADCGVLAEDDGTAGVAGTAGVTVGTAGVAGIAGVAGVGVGVVAAGVEAPPPPEVLTETALEAADSPDPFTAETL